jgi:hypothetical protein
VGDGPWKIFAGGLELEFSRSPHQAYQALSVISYYGMNKRCLIGDRRHPSMEYYLVEDRAPSKALMRNEDCIGFSLPNTEVKQIGGRWKIVDGAHWIMDFERSETEARNAWRVMTRYGFNRICFIGRPRPPMTYFVR